MLRVMKVFVAVAEAGSFTSAAHQLDLTTGYVSRSIMELETHLRTRLLNRTTRRTVLTEAGERFLQRCRAILASVVDAEAEALEAQAKPAGILRIHAMASIGQNYVVPAIAAYQERYPHVTVDLTLSQHVPDLLEEGYDVALRLSPDALPDSNYISRHVGTMHGVLCASPSYLAMHGTPASVGDLANHRCLQVAMSIFPAEHWRLIGPDGEHEIRLPDTRFKVNLPDALAAALQEGMGIGALPTLTIRSLFKSGALVRVLPDYHLQTLNIYTVYASRHYLDAKIRTWVDFSREWVEDALKADAIAAGEVYPTRATAED